MDAKIHVPTLVALIAATAKSDKTNPNPQSLHTGWLTDELFRRVEVYVMVGEKRYDLFTAIGYNLRLAVASEPTLTCLAGLAYLNGTRRIEPLTAELEEQVFEIIAALEAEAASLPPSLRKDRCVNFLGYQFGVFLDRCGRFDLAVAKEEETARAAQERGDAVAAAISRYLALVYRYKHTLVTGTDSQEAFDALKAGLADLLAGIAGSPLEGQWEANGIAHLLLAEVWANQPMSGGLLARLNELTPQFDRAFLDIVFLLNNIQMFNDGNREPLVLFAESAAPELKATAVLVITRNVAEAGEIGMAREGLNEIPEAGAQHVRAVAQRELAALGK